MIVATNLTKVYPASAGAFPALDGATLHIHQGEYAAIIGPSGSGKSTLMHLLGCLDTPTSGTYRLHGQDVSALDGESLARVRGAEIGFVFQGFQLIPRLTALENVMLPLILTGAAEMERRERAERLLRRVGLEARMHHRPAELSGGQQQRVAIARALIRQPPVVLADEPTGSLDPCATREVLALLSELHADGHTVVLITHDMAVARAAQRRFIMEGGRLRSE